MARLETGPLQEGDDWPGVFIRGDNALMGYAPALEAILKHQPDSIAKIQCKGLLDLLKSANAHTKQDVQKVRLVAPEILQKQDGVRKKKFGDVDVHWAQRARSRSAWISVGNADKGPHFQCDFYGDLDAGPVRISDFACEPPKWVGKALKLSKS